MKIKLLLAFKEIKITVSYIPAGDIIQTIPLSNSTVQRPIDEMTENIEDTLCNYLKTWQFDRGDFCLFLSKFESDINNLVEEHR